MTQTKTTISQGSILRPQSSRSYAIWELSWAAAQGGTQLSMKHSSSLRHCSQALLLQALVSWPRREPVGAVCLQQLPPQPRFCLGAQDAYRAMQRIISDVCLKLRNLGLGTKKQVRVRLNPGFCPCDKPGCVSKSALLTSVHGHISSIIREHKDTMNTNFPCVPSLGSMISSCDTMAHPVSDTTHCQGVKFPRDSHIWACGCNAQEILQTDYPVVEARDNSVTLYT